MLFLKNSEYAKKYITCNYQNSRFVTIKILLHENSIFETSIIITWKLYLF